MPSSFEVPDRMETDRFRLRMLSVGDVIADYEAVVESRNLSLFVKLMFIFGALILNKKPGRELK